MIKAIRTDDGNSFFMDSITNKRLDRYDPNNLDLVLVTKMEDGSILSVKSDEIKSYKGGQIAFEYLGDKYIIDDGYQDLLIRTGYIVQDYYDSEYVMDKDKGIEIRNKLLNSIYLALRSYYKEDTALKDIKKTSNSISFNFNTNSFHYTVYIDTVNTLVNKNQQRKMDELPFYPFIKNMDKYGTMYVSIFCQKTQETDNVTEKYSGAEMFLIDFVSFMNEFDREHKYSFKRVILKKKINHCPGL